MTGSPSDMIKSSQFAAVVTDPRLPDNPIVDCNEAFLELTGYDRGEVIGRNCRLLSGPGTDPEKRMALRIAIEERRPIIVELLNYRKDGSSFMNAVMIAPIFDQKGQLLAFLGSQAEVQNDGLGRENQSYNLIQSLPPRQRQVVKMMAEGKMIKEMAFELDLHERTVKMHRAAALKSLGVETSVGAIRIAIEAGY